MAVFYGQVKEEHFRKQVKENRKIEEVILMFATNATNVLRKEPSLAGDGWKVELNNQIAQFIKLLRDCLRNVSHVSPDLTARLDTYAAKLAPSLPPIRVSARVGRSALWLVYRLAIRRILAVYRARPAIRGL